MSSSIGAMMAVRNAIDDVINNGRIIKERWEKYNLEKDGRRVVLSRNLRDDKGNIIQARKNWVVTAYDNNKPKRNRKGASALVTPSKPDEGAGAVAPNLSDGKFKEKSADVQEPGEKR